MGRHDETLPKSLFGSSPSRNPNSVEILLEHLIKHLYNSALLLDALWTAVLTPGAKPLVQ
jgi:hypothetical protein